MNKKQLLEFIPLAIFIGSEFCRLLNVPYSSVAQVLSGGLLSCLYFYASFWLYSAYAISPANRIIAGVAFSTAIIGCIFSFMDWQFWHIFDIIASAGTVVVIAICLFNRQNPGYKQLLYRSVFFLALLAAAYSYRLFSV